MLFAHNLAKRLNWVKAQIEELFDWIDARPRRHLFVRLIIFSLLLWSSFGLICLVTALFF